MVKGPGCSAGRQGRLGSISPGQRLTRHGGDSVPSIEARCLVAHSPQGGIGSSRGLEAQEAEALPGLFRQPWLRTMCMQAKDLEEARSACLEIDSRLGRL